MRHCTSPLTVRQPSIRATYPGAEKCAAWELEAMFGDVLAIVLAPTLPTPNHRKTITLAVWILQSQRLPDSVLVPKLHTILSAVARLLKHIRAQADDEMRVDGIKVPDQICC